MIDDNVNESPETGGTDPGPQNSSENSVSSGAQSSSEKDDSSDTQNSSEVDTSSEVQNSSEKDASSGTTYSWVNPKLRRDSADEEDSGSNNPWSGSDGTNYWRTSTGGETGSSSGGASDGGTHSRYDTYQTGSYRNASRPESERSTYGYRPENSGRKPEKKHRKRSGGDGTGRKWALVVSMAVVFGLIAGVVSVAVNAAGSRLTASASGGSQDSGAQQSGGQDSSDSGEAVSSSADSSGDQTEVSAGSSDSSSSGTLSVEQVAKNALPAMVTISTLSVEEMQSIFGGTQQYQVQGAGSGIIVGQNDEELLIATNNHVISGASQVSVGFADESVCEAQIKGSDSSNDLAVVSVKKSEIASDTLSAVKVIQMGNSDDLKLGQQVVAIGNALGYGQSVTAGYVSALNRELTLSDGSYSFTSSDLIQTDAAINSGNSGGALLNMSGELVGISEAKSSQTSSGATVDNMGYAIPISKAEPILDSLMSAETRDVVDEADRGYLGVTCIDVTSTIAEEYNMPEGVCFQSVVSGGPADEAGAKQGDVLVEFDGRSVSSYSDLQNILQYYKAGETIDIVVKRSDGEEYKEQTLSVTLGDSSDYQKAQQEAQNNSEQQEYSGEGSGSPFDYFFGNN